MDDEGQHCCDDCDGPDAPGCELSPREDDTADWTKLVLPL